MKRKSSQSPQPITLDQNVNAALKGVIIRLVKGERVRVKSEYKEVVLDIMQEEHPSIKLLVESEDNEYAYIRQPHKPSTSFSPEDMARAVHDCSGNPVVSEEGVVTGYGLRGLEMPEISSTQCYAKQIKFIDQSRNEFYIASTKHNTLLDPTQPMSMGRAGWIRCNAAQFGTYLTVLSTGRNFHLGQLRNELNVN